MLLAAVWLSPRVVPYNMDEFVHYHALGCATATHSRELPAIRAAATSTCGCCSRPAAVAAGHQRASSSPANLRYAGVLAPASPWRSRLAPQTAQAAAATDDTVRPDHAGGYRAWAELLARTVAVDVLACPRCQGRMGLLAQVKDPANIARHLATVGEATEVPR